MELRVIKSEFETLSEVLDCIDNLLHVKYYAKAIGIAHRIIAQYEEKRLKLSKFL